MNLTSNYSPHPHFGYLPIPLAFFTPLGKPIISEDYPSKASISNIQHVHNCLEFCKENFDAVITQGTTFRGKDFKVSRVFCDLTLRYNPSDFRDFVTSELDVNKCREFADKLCRNGLNISHALQQ